MEIDHSGDLLTVTMWEKTQAPPVEDGQCVINRLHADRSCPEQQQTSEEKFEKQPRRLQTQTKIQTKIPTSFGQLNFSQS